jgi:hypothetical protein
MYFIAGLINGFFDIHGNPYILMKKSDEFGSPTSPASFLKKQSHIITNNGVSQEYFQLTPNTRYEL